MIAIKGKNEDEIAKLFQKFAKKYRHEYSDTTWEFIEENFWIYIYSNVCPDLLMQIYTELGIESPNGNFYKEHAKRVQERFDIGCSVLDIGSGKIPAFANTLAQEQLRIGKGTITLYEPLLIETKPYKVAILEIRSHAAWYLKGIPGSSKLKVEICKAKKISELIELLDNFRKEQK